MLCRQIDRPVGHVRISAAVWLKSIVGVRANADALLAKGLLPVLHGSGARGSLRGLSALRQGMSTPVMAALLATDPGVKVQEHAVRQAWFDFASERFDFFVQYRLCARCFWVCCGRIQS